MKAITLYQPYASLIAVGAKLYETRHWAPPPELIGQRIAIHAGKSRADMDNLDPDYPECPFAKVLRPVYPDLMLPFGAVVCTAVLVAAFQCGPEAAGTVHPARKIARMRTSRPFPECFTVRVDDFGDYSIGRWAWLLKDVQRIEPPVPVNGRQGFWEWEPAAR